MLARVLSSAVLGIEAYIVEVETDLFPLEKGSVTDEKLREKMNGYLAKAGLKKVDQNQKGVIRDFRGNDKTEEKEEEITPNLQPKKGFTWQI